VADYRILLVPGSRGDVLFKIERLRVGEEKPEYIVSFKVLTPEGVKELSFRIGGREAEYLSKLEEESYEKFLEYIRDKIIHKYLKIHPDWRLIPESITVVRTAHREWIVHGRPAKRSIELFLSPEAVAKLVLLALATSEVKSTGREKTAWYVSIGGGGEELFSSLLRAKSEAEKHPLKEARAEILKYAELLERAIREAEGALRVAETLAKLRRSVAEAEQYLRGAVKEISARYELKWLGDILHRARSFEELVGLLRQFIELFSKYTRRELERAVSRGEPWLHVLRRFLHEIGPAIIPREKYVRLAKLLVEAERIPESPTYRFRQLVEQYLRAKDISRIEWLTPSLAESIRKLRALHEFFKWLTEHFPAVATQELEKVRAHVRQLAEKTAREILGLIELTRIGGVPSRIVEEISQVLGVQARTPAEVILELHELVKILERLGAEKMLVNLLKRRIEELKQYYLEELEESKKHRRGLVVA
jgi:hypothetical protein